MKSSPRLPEEYVLFARLAGRPGGRQAPRPAPSGQRQRSRCAVKWRRKGLKSFNCRQERARPRQSWTHPFGYQATGSRYPERSFWPVAKPASDQPRAWFAVPAASGPKLQNLAPKTLMSLARLSTLHGPLLAGLGVTKETANGVARPEFVSGVGRPLRRAADAKRSASPTPSYAPACSQRLTPCEAGGSSSRSLKSGRFR